MPALILMYHDLVGRAEVLDSVQVGHRPYVLDSSTFRVQVRAVAAMGVPVLTVSQWAMGHRPERAILLTFDDGHVSNFEEALPILLEYEIKATFFITAGFIGSGNTMNWSQIRALHANGMEIGSHTLTHRLPSTLNDSELHYELVQSRQVLEDGLGVPVTSISSPTGFFNPRMCNIARAVGYRALCFGQAGLVPNDVDPFLLKRVAIKRDIRNDRFDALLHFERGLMRRLRFQQWFREMARKTFNPDVYLRLRRILMKGVARG